MNALEKLFGNPHRIKLLRLFLFNPGIAFDRKEISRRSKVNTKPLAKELSIFKKIKLIKERKIKTKSDAGKIGSPGLELDLNFSLISSLQSLLNQDFLQKKTNITKRF